MAAGCPGVGAMADGSLSRTILLRDFPMGDASARSVVVVHHMHRGPMTASTSPSSAPSMDGKLILGRPVADNLQWLEATYGEDALDWARSATQASSQTLRALASFESILQEIMRVNQTVGQVAEILVADERDVASGRCGLCGSRARNRRYGLLLPSDAQRHRTSGTFWPVSARGRCATGLRKLEDRMLGRSRAWRRSARDQRRHRS